MVSSQIPKIVVSKKPKLLFVRVWAGGPGRRSPPFCHLAKRRKRRDDETRIGSTAKNHRRQGPNTTKKPPKSALRSSRFGARSAFFVGTSATPCSSEKLVFVLLLERIYRGISNGCCSLSHIDENHRPLTKENFEPETQHN
jgi:hypothetical protein